MIVETDVSEYTIIAILSIIIKEKEIHLVVFYSCIFKATKLKYDMHDKELFTVFEVFCM